MKNTLHIIIFLQLIYIAGGFSQVSVTNSTGADGTYSTMKSAFDQINLFPQSGNNILITITANTVETSSAVLNESSNPWSSLKIIPSANVVISGSINGPLISLSGADNVVIDGMNGGNTLTIDNANTGTTASTIRFMNDATDNKITNCIIKGSSTGDNSSVTYGGVIWIYTGTAEGNDNDTISNCDIGPSGSNLPFMAIRGYGTSGAENDDVVISNNTIHDFFCSTSTTGTEGVYVSLYNNAWTIDGNKFYQSATRTYTITASEYRAIFIDNTSTPGGGYLIQNNVIGYSSSSLAGTTIITGSSNMIRGIYIKTSSSSAISTISNNTIAEFNQTTSRNGTTSTIGNSPFIAIAIDAAGPVTVSNNLIGSSSGTGSIVVNHNLNSFTSTIPVIGIFSSGSSPHTISDNAIGGITLNKISTLESLSFNGIRTEGSGAVTILSNTIGNSTSGNISSNFTTGLLVGIHINTSITSITADGNVIQNFSHAGDNDGQIVGIDLFSASGTVIISNNTITELTYSGNSDGYVVVGIQTSSSSNAIYSIIGNHISGLSNIYSSPFAYSYIHGMIMNHTGTTGHIISFNEIYDLTIAGGGNVIAILIFDAGFTFINNMISVGFGLPVNTSIGCYGFYFLSFSYPGYFYFNTVLIGGNSTMAGNFNLAMNLTGLPANSELVNNIIINDRTTPSPAQDQAIYIGTGGGMTNITMDHNNIYVNPSTTYLIKKVSTGYTTLAAWQAAYNVDLNSISESISFVDPQFDLHATTSDCEILSGKGTPVAGITTDIDSDPRDPLNPGIGADECSLLLPVELMYFDADVIHPSLVIISWSTASEVNNDYFEVERSSDGKVFQPVGRLPGYVFSSSLKEYQMEDVNPFPGISYYRLKQMDIDGSSTYSDWISIKIASDSSMFFFPNPVTAELIVSSFLQKDESVMIILYDIKGELVLKQWIQASYPVINVSSLTPGLYFLTAESRGRLIRAGIIKQ